MSFIGWLTDRKQPRRSVLIMCAIGGCLSAAFMLAATLLCIPHRASFACSIIEKSPPWALLAGLATLPGVVLGWYWRTDFKNHELDSAEERGRAERFVKYAEMLAHDKGPALLGGIHGLRHLAIEDEKRKGLVVDVLCSFIRSWASRDQIAEHYQYPDDDNELPSPPSLAVATAIEALSSLKASGADLRNVDLEHIAAEGAILTDTDFREANLFEARLRGADLSRSCLDEANCTNAKFPGANLSGASFVRARLWGTVLSDADLTGADLSHADLETANLSKAKLTGAKLVSAKLEQAYLQRADLQGANLSRADLKAANLQDANLVDADLQGANLEGANLQGATLRNANLQDARLAGATVTRQQLVKTRGGPLDAPLARVGDPGDE